MKVIFFYLLLTSLLSPFIYAKAPAVNDSKIQVKDGAEPSDDVARILEEVGDREIQTPEIQRRSAFMVWVTSFGISLLSITPRPIRKWILKIAGKSE